MTDPATAWWRLAQSVADIAWHAPFVIQHRSARMLASPEFKHSRDRREAARMVAEKFEALLEAQFVLWQQGVEFQQRIALQAWQAALSGRSPKARWPSATASLKLAHRALAPVRRRVKANSRRLKSR